MMMMMMIRVMMTVLTELYQYYRCNHRL